MTECTNGPTYGLHPVLSPHHRYGTEPGLRAGLGARRHAQVPVTCQAPLQARALMDGGAPLILDASGEEGVTQMRVDRSPPVCL